MVEAYIGKTRLFAFVIYRAFVFGFQLLIVRVDEENEMVSFCDGLCRHGDGKNGLFRVLDIRYGILSFYFRVFLIHLFFYRGKRYRKISIQSTSYLEISLFPLDPALLGPGEIYGGCFRMYRGDGGNFC